jgi:hypothetical protein
VPATLLKDDRRCVISEALFEALENLRNLDDV